jgi:hypothetical protein
MAFTFARPAAGTGRIDIAALKQTHPIEAVVPQYGVELKHQGRGLVGRCPFHLDGGRPNLVVFPTEIQTNWLLSRQRSPSTTTTCWASRGRWRT